MGTSLWNDHDAAQFTGDLAQRVYTSRLLGRDPSLVLHGGGNTSVKIRERDIFGGELDVLYIKSSGSDLATIETADFAPCRLAHLRRLAELPALSDTQMVAEFKSSLTSPAAPQPSVEAILHALLPARFVDHTHADALLAVMNTPNGADRVREIYGDAVVVIPYVMPGFKLARACAERLARHANPQMIGMVLLHHGLFTFGATARESYERMIDLVTRAEAYLAEHGAWKLTHPAASTTERQPNQMSFRACEESQASGSEDSRDSSQARNDMLTDGRQRVQIAALRRDVSTAAGVPMILTVADDPGALAFARRADVASLSQRGAATPDHAIRTKRVPMVGRDVAGFCRRYEEYFQTHAAGRNLTMVDPAPRVILDPEFGLATAGRTAGDALIAGDIYRHTIEIILRAEALGGWRALPASDMFEMEYWELQQAKLRKAGASRLFTGEVALVTGAASGIGAACVTAFFEQAAAVVALDRNPEIAQRPARPDFLGITCDLTNEDQIRAALGQAVPRFGGLDMLVLNAGIFPKACALSEMTTAAWRQVMQVNLDATFALMRESHPLLKLAPRRGRVAIIGSKNVPAPGPGVAAYSASKAAVNQLARVAALEWGGDGIRVNSLHPNMVFDTAIWTPEVLAARAKHYGLTVEQYKTNNVLRVPVSSADVAGLAVALCGPLFAKTTAAQIPVDGGNDRVI